MAEDKDPTGETTRQADLALAYEDALDALNPQHRLFVRAYLAQKELNATEAARQSGYSLKTAHVQACNLLKSPKISHAVKAGMAMREVTLGLTADWVMNRLKRVSDQAVDAAPVFNAKGKIVAGVWQQDSNGANKATELIGKHIGMFGTDKAGALSLETHNHVTEQMGIEVLAAIKECVSDEAVRTALVTAVDRRWSAISVEPNRPGAKRAP